MIARNRLGALLAPLTLVLGNATLSGCASSDAARAPASASDQATAFTHARCGGFADESLLADVLNGKTVESVTPLYSGGGSSKTNNPRLLGAVVYVRPAAGETAEWLNRALECHAAKRTSDRASAFASPSDPFFLPDSHVRIRVQPAGDSFKVDIEGISSADARDIFSRASAFATASGAAQGLAAQPELP
jgi:hypothetical protein